MTDFEKKFQVDYEKWHKSVIDDNKIVFTDMVAQWAMRYTLEEAAKVAETHYADLLNVEKYTKAGICQSVATTIRAMLTEEGR